MPQSSRIHPHFFLSSSGQSELFTSRSSGGGGGSDLPEQNRQAHGQKLMDKLSEVKAASTALKESTNADDLSGPIGIQIEFKGFPDVELAFQSLASERSKNGAENIEVQLRWL